MQNNMYTIQYTRCTGETGVYRSFIFETKSQAEKFVKETMKLDRAKRMQNAYKYEIIEIGNSAK